MGYFKRYFPITLVLTLGISISLYAQKTSTAETDSSFEAYMSDAWDEIRETNSSDSLQNVYSRDFYEYYQQHPNTETGKKALMQAFLMWGNTGNAKYIDEALQTLDYDSEMWAKIINSLANIHFRNDSLEIDTYEKLLYDLKDRLTHPESRSAVLLRLVRSNKDDNTEEAKKFAQELVEIDASEFFVDQGLGYLHEFESLNIGQQAHDFNAQTINGEDISLSDLNGHYVLLDFWATWCGPCIPEIPHLKTLWDRYKDSNFEIVGISLDRQKNNLTEFIEERNIEWPQILETEGWDGEITQMYNVVGIPRTYLIDPDGVIIAKDLRGEEMVEEIEKYINE